MTYRIQRANDFQPVPYVSPMMGLGYDLAIKTPVGTQHIKLNLEDLVKEVAVDAAKAAWPTVEGKIKNDLIPYVMQNVVPPLMKKVEDEVMTELWPAMQPKIRAEVARVEESVTKKAAIGLAVLVAAIGGAAWYMKRKGA